VRNPKTESRPRGRLAAQFLVSDVRNTLARHRRFKDSDFGFRVSFGLRPSGFGLDSL